LQTLEEQPSVVVVVVVIVVVGTNNTDPSGHAEYSSDSVSSSSVSTDGSSAHVPHNTGHCVSSVDTKVQMAGLAGQSSGSSFPLHVGTAGVVVCVVVVGVVVVVTLAGTQMPVSSNLHGPADPKAQSSHSGAASTSSLLPLLGAVVLVVLATFVISFSSGYPVVLQLTNPSSHAAVVLTVDTLYPVQYPTPVAW